MTSSGASLDSGGRHVKWSVYAPHSNVEIVGNGQWYGAFVGNALRETGRSAVHYYRPLAGP